VFVPEIPKVGNSHVLNGEKNSFVFICNNYTKYISSSSSSSSRGKQGKSGYFTPGISQTRTLWL
jgi:hypothetical protein